MRQQLVLIGALLGICMSCLQAQIPHTVSYQGVLTDANGNAVPDGNVALTFRLFDVVSGGTALWEETQQVAVGKGVFNANLGSATPLNLPFDKPYWVGITVAQGAELIPRVALTASPYSLNSHSTIAEPGQGQGLTIRDTQGNATHVLSPNGDVLHKGKGMFEQGINVGSTTAGLDTPIVAISANGPAIVGISGNFAQGRASSKSNSATKSGNLDNAVAPTSDEGDVRSPGPRNGTGVAGVAETEVGVLGESQDGIGVAGQSQTATGVFGSSKSNNGVQGQSETFTGVDGVSKSGTGVSGGSETGVGVHGQSPGNIGVSGTSQTGNGVQGNSNSGVGVAGASTDGPGILGRSVNGPGGIFVNGMQVFNSSDQLIFEIKPDGTSLHTGLETFQSGIKFGDGTVQSTAGTGGSSGWVDDPANNKVTTTRNVGITGVIEVRNAANNRVVLGIDPATGRVIVQNPTNGGVMFEVSPDSNRGVTVVNPTNNRVVFAVTPAGRMVVQNPATNQVVFEVKPDGTSLHKGDETFEGDVILKGQTGKGAKLVDANGITLAGFGRIDSATNQRLGVYGKAETAGDLAGAFDGNVEIDGEVYASSLHIVKAPGDTVMHFNADGTSEHSGLETFKAGLQTVLSNGNILRINPSEGLTLKTATGQFRGHMDPNGNAFFFGNVSKGGGSFKIDHPLDPANKYLYHSFVESPDMMNIYNGNVTLDDDGEAVVRLPAWFEALNRDFRYQLTAIGAPGPNLYVAEKISGNRFKIAGGTDGMEVSWQVTGVRKDAYAERHRIPVEESKPATERGHYLHPEAFGLPTDMGMSMLSGSQRESGNNGTESPEE